MQLPTMLQGREFGPEHLAQVQALLGQHEGWSRYRLSRELARRWDWRTSQGQLKDIGSRAAPLSLFGLSQPGGTEPAVLGVR